MEIAEQNKVFIGLRRLIEQKSRKDSTAILNLPSREANFYINTGEKMTQVFWIDFKNRKFLVFPAAQNLCPNVISAFCHTCNIRSFREIEL